MSTPKIGANERRFPPLAAIRKSCENAAFVDAGSSRPAFSTDFSSEVDEAQ
jgi:hypothetical protein